MTSSEIRKSFLNFFREKEHTIVPSSSLLPDSPNLLFTNAGMNQFVPIFLGQQKPAWNPPRVADTQKCIRAGGKHNDLEDVGLDTYHLTFFEMLGNWSFGDYFKKEAIEWAWELIVDRWKLPPQRLYATVYKPGPGDPSEFDQEAHDHWERLFREADLDPAIHIVNGNKKDNFWMMGDTGPCGPCSELHVDLTPDGDTRGALVNKDDPRCIEIWNLVFIQFNANADGTFTPLPQRHVDTGMGFERMAGFYAATKGFTDFTAAPSAYDADDFTQIFNALEKLSGKKYTRTLPEKNFQPSTTASPARTNTQLAVDIAFRVVADHIRALSSAIADGIIPSNEGRGYVLRRILRRAVRYGRSLGFHEPFFFKLVDVLAKTMGDVFPEVREKQKHVKETIKREEESFNRTIDAGMKLFEKKVSMVLVEDGVIPAVPQPKPTIPGEVVFELYDTYGFPPDLTELIARERGIQVDMIWFDKLLSEQRERARKAQKKEKIELSNANLLWGPTKFVGFDRLKTEGGEFFLENNRLYVEVSPFYAEMGGQVGDTGWIEGTHGERTIVLDTVRSPDGVHVLQISDPEVFGPDQGIPYRQIVDADRRKLIQGHHTVTHILHWALHELVSRDAAQKGSYVGPDKLTFDFSSAALTPQQKRDVEKMVNEKVAENVPVSWTEIPYAEAKKRSDIQQFFGDKYGDTVRVVQIGGEAKALNGYSMELCGGTHVRATGEIEHFHIVKEEAIAAGIRRIEAVAGNAVNDWTKHEAARQQGKFEMLSRKKPGLGALPDFANEGKAAAMLAKIDMRAAHLEKLEAEVRDWEKQNAKSAEAELRTRAIAIANELAASHAKEKFCVAEVKNGDGKLLQAVVDALKGKLNAPIVLAGATDGNVALIAAVPKDLMSKFQADKIIQQIAPIVGGKGGGRPEGARGAGKDAGKIGDALARARALMA